MSVGRFLSLSLSLTPFSLCHESAYEEAREWT